MKNTLRQVFHSSKFVVGFVIFVAILLTLFIYPLINPGNPLEMIGVGTFARPGTYFSLYDAVKTPTETLRLANADDKRLGKQLSDEDRVAIVAWLSAVDVNVEGLDVSDTEALLEQWRANYDPSVKPKGMTQAKRNYYKRLDAALKEVNAADTLIIADKNEDGQLEQQGTITKTDYVNVGQVANVKKLPLGTDNFGRDVLKELVSAAGTSIVIGLLAGLVATLLGLSLGLLSGYIGGLCDDIIMFFTNIFTVIPGFVLLILISYSIGQEQRGAAVVALVIGLTSWTWTCRSVRSQVIQLCSDGLHPAGVLGHTGRGAAVAAGPGPEDHRGAHAGPDDELGHAVFGPHQRLLVGLLPRDFDDYAHIVLAESDEYRPRPGVQPDPERLKEDRRT